VELVDLALGVGDDRGDVAARGQAGDEERPGRGRAGGERAAHRLHRAEGGGVGGRVEQRNALVPAPGDVAVAAVGRVPGQGEAAPGIGGADGQVLDFEVGVGGQRDGDGAAGHRHIIALADDALVDLVVRVGLNDQVVAAGDAVGELRAGVDRV